MGGSEDAELPGDSVLQWPEGTYTPESPTVVTGAQDDSEEDTAANGATAPGHDAPARRRRRRRARGARRRRRTPGGAWADQELAPLKRGERGASDDAHGGERQQRLEGLVDEYRAVASTLTAEQRESFVAQLEALQTTLITTSPVPVGGSALECARVQGAESGSGAGVGAQRPPRRTRRRPAAAPAPVNDDPWCVGQRSQAAAPVSTQMVSLACWRQGRGAAQRGGDGGHGAKLQTTAAGGGIEGVGRWRRWWQRASAGRRGAHDSDIGAGGQQRGRARAGAASTRGAGCQRAHRLVRQAAERPRQRRCRGRCFAADVPPAATSQR